MQVAFYAPMKSPQHPLPSGDRTIARLLMQALSLGGCDVELASSIRSWSSRGDPFYQLRIGKLMERLAERLLRQWERRHYRPDIWFTYHSYYKAPDWLGPLIVNSLHIPYVIAEASWAEKRCTGAWSINSRAVERGLQQAACIFQLNPVDGEALKRLLGKSVPLISLPPFIDTERNVRKDISRQQLADRWCLDLQLPWLLCVAMMREGDKQASYSLLARAFSMVARPCELLLIGDGEVRKEVELAFQGETRVHLLGRLCRDDIFPLLAEGYLYVWPAVNEAFGMVFLEAQWMQLPVLTCNEGGVSSVVLHDRTGYLLAPGDPEGMATAMTYLLDHPETVRRWSANCRGFVERSHSLAVTSSLLIGHLRNLISCAV